MNIKYEDDPHMGHQDQDWEKVGQMSLFDVKGNFFNDIEIEFELTLLTYQVFSCKDVRSKFYFCSCSYWVKLWSIKVQLIPPETTVALVFLDIVAVAIVVADFDVFVVVLALLVVTDYILFSCGQ